MTGLLLPNTMSQKDTTILQIKIKINYQNTTWKKAQYSITPMSPSTMQVNFNLSLVLMDFFIGWLTTGGVGVTWPNGAGRFILFIKCKTYKEVEQYC